MKVFDLFTGRISNNVSNTSVVIVLFVFRIPDEFIDKVSEMQDKAELVSFARALIFEDHASISILCSCIGVLAACERKTYRPAIVICGRCDCSADPAPEALRVGEAIPVNL